MHDEFGAPFNELLAKRCTPDVVRCVERGEASDALWEALEASGFADALVPEARGGAGLSLLDVLPIVQACGYHAVPLPFAETMAARAVLAHEGHNLLAGPLTLDVVAGLVAGEDRLALQAALLTAQIAGAATRVVELTLIHAQQRSQFGKPIGAFQAIQNQLAVMAEHVCVARMAARLCFASSTHLPDRMLAAMAKGMAGEAAAAVAAAGHAVHGAIGITAEFDLQLYTRRLVAWRMQAGSSAYWNRQVGQGWWDSEHGCAIDFVLDRLAVVQAEPSGESR